MPAARESACSWRAVGGPMTTSTLLAANSSMAASSSVLSVLTSVCTMRIWIRSNSDAAAISSIRLSSACRASSPASADSPVNGRRVPMTSSPSASPTGPAVQAVARSTKVVNSKSVDPSGCPVGTDLHRFMAQETVIQWRNESVASPPGRRRRPCRRRAPARRSRPGPRVRSTSSAPVPGSR